LMAVRKVGNTSKGEGVAGREVAKRREVAPGRQAPVTKQEGGARQIKGSW
jgi:hypothetical protein